MTVEPTLVGEGYPLALLQSDLVDSTRLSEKLGDAAGALVWAEHDRRARNLLEAWGGRELERTDGFLLAFPTVENAVGYALKYHESIGAMDPPLGARVGIHLGPLVPRPNSAEHISLGAKPVDLGGLSIPLAVRVMSLAMAGQVLLTPTAKAALQGSAYRIVSHGWWRMKGLLEPVEVFEAGNEDTPFSPLVESEKVYRVALARDTWLPVRDVRHTLPAQRDAFVGRQHALLELRTRLDRGHLVCVRGTGGVGKTRLAQHFGWAWLGDYSGGVWFCDLSQARDVDGMIQAVAQGLELSVTSSDPLAQISSSIAGRGKCLVIFDNFEQVADLAHETLGKWLDRASSAQFLVTSRDALNIAGEETLILDHLNEQEGEELFVVRASSMGFGFNPSEAERAMIGPIVKEVEGLPLAIELAAARTRVMSLSTLRERVVLTDRDRDKLLRSTITERPERHSTLRRVFDWSWDMLSPVDKSALAQLSVFEGGFTAESAERVLDLAAIPSPPWIFDVLQSLLDKSLIRQISGDRFDLQQSVQQYALELLQTPGSFAGSGATLIEATMQRHWLYFGSLDELRTTEKGCIELSNLIEACRRAARHSERSACSAVLIRAWAALKLRGPFQLGVELAELALTIPELEPAARGQALWVLGDAKGQLGRVERAHEVLSQGLSASQEAGDHATVIRILCSLSDLLKGMGKVEEASMNYANASALALQLNDRALQAMVLHDMGALADYQGQLKLAREHYDSGLVIAKALGDLRRSGGLIGNLGGLDHAEGRWEMAQSRYLEALQLGIDTGDRRWEGNTRCNLGLLHHDMEDAEAAQTQFEAALKIAREIGHMRLEATVLCNLGLALEAQNQLDGARQFYEDAVALARELHDHRQEGQFEKQLGELYARQRHFKEARESLSRAETLLALVRDDLSLASVLCASGELEILAGDRSAALSALSRVEALLENDLEQSSEISLAVRRLAKSLDLDYR